MHKHLASCIARRGLVRTLALAPVLLALASGLPTSPALAEGARAIPAPLSDEPTSQGPTEIAVFAGGCFWGVQGVFQRVEGVSNAVSGYAGGDKSTATYERTTRGDTGHAEAVQITFDPRKVSYGKLLQIYFSVAHDPTELNRQGPDVGTQYRSTVFPTSEAQAKAARAYIQQLNMQRSYGKPLATTIEIGKPFYPAEAYHQDFMTLNPTHPYIAMHDLPKVDDLKRLFPANYREKPALVSASAAN